jgi:hypothetical protein
VENVHTKLDGNKETTDPHRNEDQQQSCDPKEDHGPITLGDICSRALVPFNKIGLPADAAYVMPKFARCANPPATE